MTGLFTELGAGRIFILVMLIHNYMNHYDCKNGSGRNWPCLDRTCVLHVEYVAKVQEVFQNCIPKYIGFENINLKWH